jgi:hypothetical protein
MSPVHEMRFALAKTQLDWTAVQTGGLPPSIDRDPDWGGSQAWLRPAASQSR